MYNILDAYEDLKFGMRAEGVDYVRAGVVLVVINVSRVDITLV